MGCDCHIELIFWAWKHTLGGLHLINLREDGIVEPGLSSSLAIAS